MKLFIEKLKIYGLKKYIFFGLNEIRIIIFQQMGKKSYSMLEEDLIIDKLLHYKKKGFYVDIGANDPIRFSNTKRFYDKGWCGINIEPNINKFNKLKRHRPKDINLNLGIANKEGALKFFNMNVDTISTFSEKEAKKHQKEGFQIVSCKKVRVKHLSTVFARHIPNKKIDFMSIDTEGYDLEILKSNDWNKYRPHLICIEFPPQEISGNHKKDTFLKASNYVKIYQNDLNAIYKDSRNI